MSSAAIIGWGTLALGAGSAISSGVQSNKQGKANKSNQEAFNKATIQNEKEMRKLYDGFIKKYNESAEKLEEGMSLQEYVGNFINTLGDKKLEEQFRKARDGDWEQAQRFADEATDQNISAFDRVIDKVSGGDYKKFIETRNKAIFSEDVDSLYAEARRLQAPKQAAGSVVRNADGTAVGGQRGDKFEFKISETAVREQNDRTFAKTTQAIESDRSAAQRQQERAISFLPMLDYTGFAGNIARQYSSDKLQTQLTLLNQEAQFASQALSGAYKAPMPPPIIDTAAQRNQTAQATQLALAGLSDLYKSYKAPQATTAPSTVAASNAGMDRMFNNATNRGMSFS